MLKFILTSLFCLLSITINAQGFIDHIVQRGETLEFLASKFGVTEQEIRDQNEDFDLDVLFVGLLIQIPIHEVGDSPEEIERLIASKSVTSSILNEANSLYNNGSYRKAAKLYTAAIKEKATSDAYYLRGRCYLYQGKYKSAIKDLELANAGGDLSYSLKTSCESLLAEAHNRRDEQLETRSEIWGSIFAAAAVTAATVATASAASNQEHAMSTSSSYSSSLGYNLPSELQPEIAARNAVAQMNYQMKMEEENFKANYRATFKRNWGREPSDMEVMEAYTNYLQAKNDAYAATNSTTTSSTSSSTSTSGSSTSTSTRNSNSTTSKDCPSLKINNGKWYCINTGKCGMCGGDGLMDGSFGQGPNSLKCTLCGGSGKCKYCSH